jgi:hypothetical protein
LGGKALPAINSAFPGAKTDDKNVILKASASMRTNLDSVSNEIDERELQFEKHSEQRI